MRTSPPTTVPSPPDLNNPGRTLCLYYSVGELHVSKAKSFLISFFLSRIPWIDTEMESAQKRRLQRGYTESIDIEVMGLKKLTEAKCSSAPWLIASKITKQTETMWVPGGYLGFVVMTRLPGANIRQAADLNSQERQALRQSFKKAWK